VLDIYLEETGITLKELVEGKTKAAQLVKQATELKQLLNSDDVNDVVTNFQSGFIDILKQMDCYTEAVSEVIENKFELAELRLSALKAARDLGVFKFLSGKNETNSFLFSKDVREYYDINLLLASARDDRFPNSVNLCLIRDTIQDEFSYFSFLIKNGGNIYVVTDKPELPSIDYKRRGRGRGRERDFTKRINAYYFPYNFMNLEFDEEHALYRVNRFYQSTSLVEVDKANVVGTLKSMDAESVVWIGMLFWLFKKKFFAAEPIQLPQAYTGAMVETSALPASKALAKLYPVLQFDPLTVNTLNNDNPEVVKVWEHEYPSVNSWMEERYGKEIEVPDSILNVVETPADEKEYYRGELIPVRTRSEQFWDERNDDRSHIFKVNGVSSTEFGSEEHIKKNIIYYSRKNQAQAIQGLAVREFNSRKKEILEWYHDGVMNNLERIRRAIGEGKLIVEIKSSDSFDENQHSVSRNVLHPLHDVRKHDSYFYAGLCLHSNRWKNCYWGGQRASYRAQFRIKDSESIAAMCGVSVDELPDVLQNIRESGPYTGNSILSTLDPMNDINNPWEGLNYNVEIYISKRTLNLLRKQYGWKGDQKDEIDED
jgi:hypothetical protein